MIRVGLNGFGRIGRCAVRRILSDPDHEVQIVAVNAPRDVKMYAHMLKYDSVHGVLTSDIEVKNESIYVDGSEMAFLHEKDPATIQWSQLNVDFVIDCTGKFKTTDELQKHINGGAKAVILSAPAIDEEMKTIVLGANEEILRSNDTIISMGSCTTNCLAPLVKILHGSLNIEKGHMTTIHAYTRDQNNVDASHKDLRRARACGLSIIPTSTGAAKTLGRVLPEMQGVLDGISVRVPTANVSMIDLTFVSTKSTNSNEVNQIIKQAIGLHNSHILSFNEEPLVSIDFIGAIYSSIFDATQTKVINNNLVRIASWYDNEYGFACRLVDTIKYWHKIKN